MRAFLLAAVVLAVAAPAALAHPERKAYFPDGSVGAVPELRETADLVLTVCKQDSADCIRQSYPAQPAPMTSRLPQPALLRERPPTAAPRAHPSNRVPPGSTREKQTPDLHS